MSKWLAESAQTWAHLLRSRQSSPPFWQHVLGFRILWFHHVPSAIDMKWVYRVFGSHASSHTTILSLDGLLRTNRNEKPWIWSFFLPSTIDGFAFPATTNDLPQHVTKLKCWGWFPLPFTKLPGLSLSQWGHQLVDPGMSSQPSPCDPAREAELSEPGAVTDARWRLANCCEKMLWELWTYL